MGVGVGCAGELTLLAYSRLSLTDLHRTTTMFYLLYDPNLPANQPTLQVDLVDDFMSKVDDGLSSVVQMIMGGGKTSVVAPILALFLADGTRLVTLLCPDQLLPQSMNEISSKFSQIINRDVLEFKFARQEGNADQYDKVRVVCMSILYEYIL